ncbi:MAG: PspC domain-containing protein [Spirochaetaceae bacterium]|nr:PspC domain-containing protein [Spirochaetaceae bacterium]MBP5792312.1 PspC domain-containing protein [Spirochaetaceae bacterium]
MLLRKNHARQIFGICKTVAAYRNIDEKTSRVVVIVVIDAPILLFMHFAESVGIRKKH